MLRTLVLDGTYQPISVLPLHYITWESAVTRVLNGTCHTVAEYDEQIKTPTLVMNKPAVVVRTDKIQDWERQLGVNAEAIYYRDGCKCQYCGKPLRLSEITLDHVVPESKGGKRVFDNIVAACYDCNSKKGNKMPEGDWKPTNKPFAPTYWQLLKMRRRYPIIVGHESWIDWIGPWEAPIHVIDSGGM